MTMEKYSRQAFDSAKTDEERNALIGQAYDEAHEDYEKIKQRILEYADGHPKWDDDSYNDLSKIEDRIKDDRDFILKLVKKWPFCYRYGSEEVRSDREIVDETLKAAKTADAVLYMPKALLADKDLMLRALKINTEDYSRREEDPTQDKTLRDMKDLNIYETMSKELFNDRDFVLAAASIDARIGRYVPAELSRDRDFMAKLHDVERYSLRVIPYTFE